MWKLNKDHKNKSNVWANKKWNCLLDCTWTAFDSQSRMSLCSMNLRNKFDHMASKQMQVEDKAKQKHSEWPPDLKGHGYVEDIYNWWVGVDVASQSQAWTSWINSSYGS